MILRRSLLALGAVATLALAGCGGDSVYATSNPYRPFCCERCKNLDIGAWAAEHFRVPAEAPPDEQPFGDARLQ